MNRSVIHSFLLLALLALSGCRPNSTSSCLIKGTMEDHTLDVKTIYLVPLVGPHDAAHVDSTTIENARFQFEVDSTEVKVIRVGYRYREGIEDMLVVSEPGTVNVHIGKLSSCGGTPKTTRCKHGRILWNAIECSSINSRQPRERLTTKTLSRRDLNNFMTGSNATLPNLRSVSQREL